MITPKIVEKASVIFKKQTKGNSKYHWESSKTEESPNKSRTPARSHQTPTRQTRSVQKIKTVKDTFQTYSVKYLGIAKGQIGILSKRLPMPQRSSVGKYLNAHPPADNEAPRPEEYNEQVIHTYSRPKALIPVKKKQDEQ